MGEAVYRQCRTIGIQSASRGAWAVRRMGFIQNADSAKSGPSRRCLVQSTQRHPRTSAIGLSVVPQICPTSGTRLARWACWVVGQMAFTQLAAFAALVFTAKSLAPMGLVEMRLPALPTCEGTAPAGEH